MLSLLLVQNVTRIFHHIRNKTNLGMSTMILLLSLFLSTSYARDLDTIISNGGISQSGNMFDICAVIEVEIQKIDINCNVADTANIEIRVATSTNQSFSGIKDNAGNWTLIHSESVSCKSAGTLTVLSKFNASIPLRMGECRGFYVTAISSRLRYTNGEDTGHAQGDVYSDNGDIQIKTGIGKGYLFSTLYEYTPRVWNGRVHYSIKTQISCGSRWCYYIDLYPTIGAGYTDQINIISDIDGQEVFFEMHYTIKNTHCVDPTITFTFYETDFNTPSTEWLEIYDDDNSLLQRCTASQQNACTSLFTCFIDKPLTAISVDSIRVGMEYIITMKQSSEVHKLSSCSEAINAQLVIKCSANSAQPTSAPTIFPTSAPTKNPTHVPTKNPTNVPTLSPTNFPTKTPTITPTKYPSNFPTKNPSNFPSKNPSNFPSKNPTLFPSQNPSKSPTNIPTFEPTNN
eukprot:321611_1